jgi:hypothetical protein
MRSNERSACRAILSRLVRRLVTQAANAAAGDVGAGSVRPLTCAAALPMRDTFGTNPEGAATEILRARAEARYVSADAQTAGPTAHPRRRAPAGRSVRPARSVPFWGPPCLHTSRRRIASYLPTEQSALNPCPPLLPLTPLDRWPTPQWAGSCWSFTRMWCPRYGGTAILRCRRAANPVSQSVSQRTESRKLHGRPGTQDRTRQ